MSREEKPTAAYVLSLIGGILILMGGMGMVALMAMWGWAFGMMRGWGGMMEPTLTRWWTLPPTPIMLLGVFGIISGIIVVAGAMMLNSHPEEHSKWGTVILVFSALSIFGGMGGFLIGLILGVVGGVLAISWKPA